MTDRLNKKAVLAVVVAVLVVAGAYRLWSATGNPAAVAANTRTLMDSETRELVQVHVDEQLGAFPLVNPKTGRRTLYPTEVCYASTCAAQGGTHVILNVYLGKEGPTYCPACGAVVRFHNPGPGQAATGGW